MVEGIGQDREAVYNALVAGNDQYRRLKRAEQAALGYHDSGSADDPASRLPLYHQQAVSLLGRGDV